MTAKLRQAEQENDDLQLRLRAVREAASSAAASQLDDDTRVSLGPGINSWLNLDSTAEFLADKVGDIFSFLFLFVPPHRTYPRRCRLLTASVPARPPGQHPTFLWSQPSHCGAPSLPSPNPLPWTPTTPQLHHDTQG